MNHQQDTTFMEVPGSRRVLPVDSHVNYTSREGSLGSAVLGNASIPRDKHHAEKVTSAHENFCHISSTSKSAGTKRGRSERPKTIPPGSLNTQHDETSCSDTEWYSDSDNGLNSRSEEYDTDEQDESAYESDFVGREYALPATHPFQLLRKALVLSIFSRFLGWMTSVLYIEPPGRRLQPKKRAKLTRYPKMYREEEDPNDPFTVLITAIHGYYHLACPFFIYNQQKHRECLVSHDFRSIKALLDHILRDHKEPPFCPICGSVFDTFRNRDDHIRRRACKPRRYDEVDGVNHAQRVKLIRRDHPSLLEEDRWHQIFTTIFRREHSGSVYLTEGIGLKISLLRDYWGRYGLLAVREYLSDNGYGSALQEQGEEVSALSAVVFEDLMVNIQEREEG